MLFTSGGAWFPNRAHAPDRPLRIETPAHARARARRPPPRSLATLSPPLTPLPLSPSLSPPPQLLGLRGRDYADAAIIAAYEGLAASPLPPGFSRRAADGRDVLLQEALQALRSARAAAARAGVPRDAAASRAAAAGLRVDAPLLPGALALLQEVGEADVVLSTGAAVLRGDAGTAPLPTSVARDVLLAMAHAQCALAGAALEAGGANPASAACARLEEAAGLLVEGGGGGPSAGPSFMAAPSTTAATTPLAPRLAADIAAGLADLAPACVLEQLALPRDATHAAVRAAAVRVAGAAVAGCVRPAATASPATTGPLAAAGAPLPASPVTPEWARAALSRMGAAEVVACVPRGPAGWLGIAAAAAAGGAAAVPWLFPGALEAVAAAHIVSGFTARSPSLVAAGDAILGAAGEAAGGGASVAPRVAARVLLGDPDGAAALLAAQASALALAGPGPAVPAGPGRGGDAVAHAAARARAAAAEVAWVASKAGGGGGGAAGGAGLDPLPGLVSLTEEWLARAAFPAFVDTAAAPPSPSLALYFDDPAVGTALDDRAGVSAGGPLVGRVAAAGRAAARAVAGAGRAVGAVLAPPTPPALILPAVPGARAQALAPPVRIQTAGPAGKAAGRAPPSLPAPLAAAALGAAVLAAAAASRVPPPPAVPAGRSTGGRAPVARPGGAMLRLPRLGGAARTAPGAAAAARPAAPVQGGLAAAAARLASFLPARTSAAAPVPTPAQAHAAIAAWQAAKADALGPRHATDRLAAAAAEPWRSAVSRDAAAAADAGWFWVFRLRSLKVDGVAPARPPPGAAAAAVARARLREAGDLFARTGKRSDGHSYDNAYAAEYMLVREAVSEGEGGARAAPRWKVAGVLVTGDGQ